MSTSDNNEAAFIDPRYSVLVLAGSTGRNGAQYLDVATGWRAPRPGPAIRVGRPRRAMPVEAGGDVKTVGGRTAILFMVAGTVCWTLIEYLVHRYVLHGRFPDGPHWLQHRLHRVFDPSHGDHHLRPWDGRHVNGSVDSVPFAIMLALLSLLAPLPTLPVFVATILQCYVVEEWIHYAVHFHRFRWRHFAYTRRHHV